MSSSSGAIQMSTSVIEAKGCPRIGLDSPDSRFLAKCGIRRGMSRKHNRVTFQPYTMNQRSLLPASLDELIPAIHLVRVVDRASEQLELDPLLALTKAGAPPTCTLR